MTPKRIQNTVNIYHDQFSIGELSRPAAPYAYEEGALYIPANGVKPKAGYPVFFNTSEKRFQYAKTAANLLVMVGIIQTRYDKEKEEYEDEDPITVMTCGHIVVLNDSTAVNYGDRLTWGNTNKKWAAFTFDAGSNVAGLKTRGNQQNAFPVRCSTLEGGSANKLMEVRIGY